MDIKTEIIKIILLILLVLVLIKATELLPKVLKKNYSSNKENLVLVHSFPTNSILLGGLVDYLDDYFNVYFIDLPGFTQKNPALDQISIEAYSRYVERELQRYALPSYTLGGISFGFNVISNAKLDESKCKAVIAIEPYINKNYLDMGTFETFIYEKVLTPMVENENLARGLWKNQYADKIFAILTGQPFERTRTIFREIDSKTFFGTAKYLMENTKDPVFSNTIPYILFINTQDETVDALKTEKLFKDNVPSENLLVIHTEIEHYPSDISKQYFEKKLKISDLLSVFDWINERYQKRAGV